MSYVVFLNWFVQFNCKSFWFCSRGKKMKEKKIKWLKPKLEELDGDETKGQCVSGSTNVDLCVAGTLGPGAGSCGGGSTFS